MFPQKQHLFQLFLASLLISKNINFFLLFKLMDGYIAINLLLSLTCCLALKALWI